MEQVLYKLSDGWEWRTFNDVCSNITDGAHASPKTVEEGFPYVTVRDVNNKGQIDIINCKRISEDDFLSLKKGNCLPPVDSVLLSKDGTVGKVAHVTDNYEEFVVLSSLAIIVPEKKYLSPEYLKYFLLSPEFQDHAISSKTGAAIKRIVLRTIKNFNIPIAPLEQQKRIVEKLDALLTRIDTAIEHLQESVTLADALYASSLDQVFEKVYLDYSTKPLSVLASKIGSGATPKGGQKAYKESGISLIRSLNVYDSEFKPEGLAFIDDDQAEKLSNVVVEEGDVLLNITGASIARCCVAPVELLPARVNQHVCIIRPNEELNSTYLNYLLISPKFKAALLFQGAGGATRQALTKVMVSNLEIPLPPVEMQAELVGKVNLFSQKNRALKEQVNSKISDLITLKASILDSAFKGEL